MYAVNTKIIMAMSKLNLWGNIASKTIKTNKLKFGTWNVRFMYDSGKMYNVIHEMQRLKPNILGIRETRWPSLGQAPIKKGMLHFSRNEVNHHRHGAAIIDIMPSGWLFFYNYRPIQGNLTYQKYMLLQ